MKGPRAGFRWLGTRFRWMRSLRMRVFFAILLSGMVSVILGLGWLIYLD